jgi:hypothetical protein
MLPSDAFPTQTNTGEAHKLFYSPYSDLQKDTPN